jgi:hypothetical protein
MLRIFTAETRKTQRTAKKYLIPIAIGILCVPPRLSVSAVEIETQILVN